MQKSELLTNILSYSIVYLTDCSIFGLRDFVYKNVLGSLAKNEGAISPYLKLAYRLSKQEDIFKEGRQGQSTLFCPI